MKTKASILIYIFTIMALVFVNSCSKNDTPIIEKETPKSIPVLTTVEVKDITESTANTGGNITDDGGAAVIARGVCWGTNQTPTINDNKTSDGNGNGSFISNITNLTPNTTYYVRAYATNSEGTGYGNSISLTTKEDIKVPTLSTAEVTEVTEAGAVSGGNITDDGGATVSARGVCWSTEDNPTIEDKKTTDGTGAGTFSSTLSNLKSETTYYVRSYATNNSGTGYGSTITFTTLKGTVKDIDGNIYTIVTIDNQEWMVENLRTTNYNDGTAIPLVKDNSAWKNTYRKEDPAYCWYDNNYVTYGNTFGALYNWHAVKTGKLCPKGWHVSTDAEWTDLIDFLGGAEKAGDQLKEKGTKNWQSPNTGANNNSGFTAMPGGIRSALNGHFLHIGSIGSWWTATQHLDRYAWQITMGSSISNTVRNTSSWENGYSVRCVKDK